MSDHDESFVAFAEATSARLLRTAWLTCGDPHHAEDLVQSALTEVYRHWGRLRDGEPAAYARRCIVNGQIDTSRRRKREIITEPPERAVPYAEPADSRWLMAALATLPARERQCVVLRHYCDLSEADVADLLGCSVGTVKSSSSRGLTKLRTALVEGDAHVR